MTSRKLMDHPHSITVADVLTDSAGQPTTSERRHRQRRLTAILSAVFAAAFIVRVVFVCQWFTTPYGQTPYLDAHMYDVWARDILSGHWLRDRAFYQSPLFPYVLALNYAIFGHSLWAVALIQAVISSAFCVILTLITARAFGFGASVLTGTLAVFYRPFVFYTAPVLKETFELLLVAAFLLAATQAIDKNRRKFFVWAGVWLGLGVLTRGNLILLAPPLLGLSVYRWNRKAHKNCAAFCLAFGLTIMPAALHNAVVSHDWVPLNYAAGFNFFIGNREGSDGGNAYPADVATGAGEESSTTRYAEQTVGHNLAPSEVSSFWTARATDYIAAHPGDDALLTLRKSGLFFSNQEIPDNYNLDFFMRNVPTILSGPLPGFALVFGFTIFASLASPQGKRRELTSFLLFGFAYTISVIPFYVTDRYRLPVLVFMLPVAGSLFPVLKGLLVTKRWGRLATFECLAIAGAVLSVVFPPTTITSEAIGWTGLSDIEFKLGRDSEGLDYLKKAIDQSPRDVAAYFYMNGVFADDRRDDHEAALALLSFAELQHPTEAAVMDESYGRFLLDRHRPGDALLAFRDAVRRAPDYTQAFVGIAHASLYSGSKKEALEATKMGLILEPSNPELLRLLDQIGRGAK